MDEDSRQIRTRETSWMIGIFVLGLAARSLALWNVSGLDLEFTKYLILGERLKANGFLAPEVFAYSPLYVYFLAFLLALTGEPTFPIFIAQILYGSLACVLAYRIARDLWGHRTGVVVAVVLILSRSMVLHEVTLLCDSLGTFIELALIAALLRAFRKPGLGGWIACGVLLGLLATVRPTAGLALAGLLPAMWYLLRPAARARRIAAISTLAGVALLTTLPITVQNVLVAKDLVPIISQGGYVFYSSNNYASAAIRYAPPPLLPAIEYADTHPDEDPVLFWDDALSARIARELAARNLKPSEVSSFYVRRALDPVARYPGYFLKLFLRKALGIVSAYEVHDTLAANARKKELAGLPLIPYGWIVSLGLVGIIVTRRKWRALVPLYVLAATQAVGLLVFYVIPRFRLPLEAILALFAAFAIGWWLESPRRRSLVLFTGLAAFALLAYVPRTSLMRQIERDEKIQGALAEGARRVADGRFAEAVFSVREVMALVDNPTSPLVGDAHRQLAEIYALMGDTTSARLEAERARPLPLQDQILILGDNLEEEGENVRTLTLLAEKHKEAGGWEQAGHLYARALARAPENPTTRYRLAETQLAQGLAADAVSNLELALRDGLDFTRLGLGAQYHLWRYYRDRDWTRAERHRRAFLRLSWIFRYLRPTEAELRAMEEMGWAAPRSGT